MGDGSEGRVSHSEQSSQAAARGPGVIAWTSFCVTYLATFFASTASPTRLLWYLPLERRFEFGLLPKVGLGMDFYGRLLLSIVVGLLGLLVGAAVERRLSPAQRAKSLPVLLAWMLSLAAFTAGLYAHMLWVREPSPLHLP